MTEDIGNYRDVTEKVVPLFCINVSLNVFRPSFSSPNPVSLLNNHQHFTLHSWQPELQLPSTTIKIRGGQKRAFRDEIVKNIKNKSMLIMSVQMAHLGSECKDVLFYKQPSAPPHC